WVWRTSPIGEQIGRPFRAWDVSGTRSPGVDTPGWTKPALRAVPSLGTRDEMAAGEGSPKVWFTSAAMDMGRKRSSGAHPPEKISGQTGSGSVRRQSVPLRRQSGEALGQFETGRG